jgi:hypothetical protein
MSGILIWHRGDSTATKSRNERCAPGNGYMVRYSERPLPPISLRLGTLYALAFPGTLLASAYRRGPRDSILYGRTLDSAQSGRRAMAPKIGTNCTALSGLTKRTDVALGPPQSSWKSAA